MRNRMYGGVRGRKTKVGEKLLRFSPTRLYGKGESKGGGLRGKDFLFIIVSILPVSLFRRNNLKSYPNIFSPNREINIA